MVCRIVEKGALVYLLSQLTGTPQLIEEDQVQELRRNYLSIMVKERFDCNENLDQRVLSAAEGDTDLSLCDVAIQGNRLIQVGQAGKLPADWQPDRVIEGRIFYVCPAL